MMRTTVNTQPQIIIVVCCITLRRSAYGAWGNYSVHDNKGVKNTSPTFIGPSTRCFTAGITTTAKRAFTTSRAGITTLPTAGSSTPTPSPPPTPTASSARKAFGYYKKTARVKGKKFVLNQLYASITKVSVYSYVRGIHR